MCVYILYVPIEYNVHFFVLSLNNFVPQLIEYAGRVVGYVKRHCVALAEDCRKLCLAQGPEAR